MSEKIFHWLLRLYPRRFRGEYGDAMRQLFRDRLAAETGVLGRLRLWMDMLRDLAVSVRREHRRPTRFAAAESGGYRMSEEGLAEMQRTHTRQLPIGFLSIAAGFLIAWLGHAPRWPMFAVYGLQTFLAMALLRAVGHQDHWLSYELILNEDRIQQSERGVITLTLLKTEVIRLLDMRTLGLAIQTQDPRKCIFVPSALNRYEELRDHLRNWVPMEEPPEELAAASWQHFVIPQWIFTLYPAALLVRSPYFAIPLAALMGVYFLYLLHLTRRFSALRTLPDAIIWKSFVAASLPVVFIVLLIVKLFFVLH